MTEYVETRPVDFSELSAVVGSAPPVAQNVTYERIREARSESHNWLTYYGAYDGQRFSLLAKGLQIPRSASRWHPYGRTSPGRGSDTTAPTQIASASRTCRSWTLWGLPTGCP